MSGQALLQFALYLSVLLGLARPLGAYMARVYLGHGTAARILAPFERTLYRLCGVQWEREMHWKEYAMALLIFNLLGILGLFALLRLQSDLPLHAEFFPKIGTDLAFNMAVSFVTNTDWQARGGETSLSDLTRMLGLTVQNFLSAASGMSVLVALIRGFTRTNAKTLGNFWVDLTRGVVYILLPLSLALALALVSQGVVQTLGGYRSVPRVEPMVDGQTRPDADSWPLMNGAVQSATESASVTAQILALGPAASQVAIKQLGTNGGGFFNANSAHPFENPTPLSNFLELLAILLIPAALCHTFGILVGDTRQGRTLLAAMTVVFAVLVVAAMSLEQTGNPALAALGIDQTASAIQSGGNLEGKEVRFGIANSALWAVATTAASNGSVNAMLDSFTPLGGMIPMWLMQLGEVIYGGVGLGLCGMIVFALVAVFVAGLMIGRTPEYLGKKIEADEMIMAAVIILIPPVIVLTGTAVAVLVEPGRESIANPGAHGLSEILYAFSSAANNNGSAFAGLSANTAFYNVALGLAMLVSRFGLMVPVLAIAGSLAAKKTVPAGAGTLPTHGPLFAGLLIGTIVVLGALTFFPVLALGPIVEQLQMQGSR